MGQVQTLLWMALLPLVACGSKAKLGSAADALAFAAGAPVVVAGSSRGGALVITEKGKVQAFPLTDIARWTLSQDGTEALGAVERGFVVVQVASGSVDTIAVPEIEGTPWQLFRTPTGDVAVTKMVAHWRVHRWLDGVQQDANPLSYKDLNGVWVDPGGEVFYVDTGFGLEVRDIRSGALVRAISASSNSQRFVDAMLDAENRLVTALWDDDGFQLWAPPDAPTGLWNLKEDAPFALSGDASVAAVGTADGIEVRDVDGQVVQLVQTKVGVVRVALSADGRRVAGAMTDGSLVVADVTVPPGSVTDRAASEFDAGRIDLNKLAVGGVVTAPTMVHDLRQPPRGMKWSPGGKLQGWMGTELVSLDPMTGDSQGVAIRKLAPGRPFAWSSDESTLAVMEAERVVLYSPGRRRFMTLSRLATGGGHSYLGLGGSTLVVDVDNTKVQAWSTKTGKALGDPFQVVNQIITGFSVSPDGTMLATVGDDPAIYDTATGKRVAALGGHLARVSSLDWSSDGSQLASVGNDGLLYLWDTATWTPTRKIEGVLGQVIHFNPQGSKLLVAGATNARVLSVATGAEELTLTFQGTLTSADWGELGMVLATNAGVLYVWL